MGIRKHLSRYLATSTLNVLKESKPSGTFYGSVLAFQDTLWFLWWIFSAKNSLLSEGEERWSGQLMVPLCGQYMVQFTVIKLLKRSLGRFLIPLHISISLLYLLIF